MTSDLPPFTNLRSALSHLENCLNCPYCNRVYTDPYTLTTCGHTFCSQCVIRFVSADKANCPLCHLPNWLNQSQPNRQLNALLQHYKQVRSLLGLREPLSSIPNYMKPRAEQKKRKGKKKMDKLFKAADTENPIESKLNTIQEKSLSPKDDFISLDNVTNADTISVIDSNKTSQSMVQHENIETTYNSDTDTRPLITSQETNVHENKAGNNETNITNDIFGQPEFIQLLQTFEPIVPSPIKKIPSHPHDAINANTCSQDIDINKLTLTNATEIAVDNSGIEEHFSQRLVSKLTQSPIIECIEKSCDVTTSQTRNINPPLTPILFSSQQQNNIISKQSPFIVQDLDIPTLPILPTNLICSQEQEQEQEHAISYKSPLIVLNKSPPHTPNAQTPSQVNVNTSQNKAEYNKPDSPLVEQIALFSSQSEDTSPPQSPLMDTHIPNSQLTGNTRTLIVKDTLFSPQIEHNSISSQFSVTEQSENPNFTPSKQTHSFTPKHTPSNLFSSQKQDTSPPQSPLMETQATHIPNSQLTENTRALIVKDTLFNPQIEHNSISSQFSVTEQSENPNFTPSKQTHSLTPKHTPSNLFSSQKQDITESPIIENSPINPSNTIIPTPPQQHNTNHMQDSIIIEDSQSLPGKTMPEKTSQTTYLSPPTTETIVLSDDSLDTPNCNNSRIGKQSILTSDEQTHICQVNKLNTRNRYVHTPLQIERISHNTPCPIVGINGPFISSFVHSFPQNVYNSQPSCKSVKKQTNSADSNYSQFFSKAYTQPLINQTKDYQLFCTTTPGIRYKFPQQANAFNTTTPQVFRNIIHPPTTNILHKNLTETEPPNSNTERNQTIPQQQQQQLKYNSKSVNISSLAQQGIQNTSYLNSPQRDSTETVVISPILSTSPIKHCLNVGQNQYSPHSVSSTPGEVGKVDHQNVDKLPSPYFNEIIEPSINSDTSLVISTDSISEDVSNHTPSPNILTPANRDMETDNILSPLATELPNASIAAGDCTTVELVPSQSPSPIIDTMDMEAPIEEVSESNNEVSTSTIMSQDNISPPIVEYLLMPSPTYTNPESVDSMCKDVKVSNTTPQNSNSESNQLNKLLTVSPNQPITTLFTSRNKEISDGYIDTKISTDTLNALGKLSPLRNFTPSYKDKFHFSPKTPPSYSQFSQMNDVLSVARGLGDKLSRFDQIDSDNDSVFSLSQNSPKPNIAKPINRLNLTPPQTNATNHTNSLSTVSSLANGKIHGNERPTSHEAPVISQYSTLTDSYFSELHTGSFSIIDYADMSIEESMDKSLHFSPSIGSPPTLNPIKRRSHSFQFKKLKLSHRGFTNEQTDFQTLRVLSPTKNNGISNELSKPRSKLKSKRRGFQAN